MSWFMQCDSSHLDRIYSFTLRSNFSDGVKALPYEAERGENVSQLDVHALYDG
jgi:hypothetical protein